MTIDRGTELIELIECVDFSDEKEKIYNRHINIKVNLHQLLIKQQDPEVV